MDGLEPTIMTLGSLPPDQLDDALESTAPTRNAFTTFSSQNTMFTFCNAFSSRLSNQRILRQQGLETLITANLTDDLPFDELLAMSGDDNQVVPRGSTVRAAKRTNTNAIWLDGFAEFSHQNAQNQSPAFSIFSGGLLVGLDYFYFENGQISGAIGYANNDIEDSQDAGTGSIDFYTASFYGTGYPGDGYIDCGFWITYNHYRNHRHVFFPTYDKTTHSSHTGMQFTPHLGGGYDFTIGNAVLEPFTSFDWVVDFQNGYRESGAMPLNMRVPGSISSMLRSEVGLNSYQTRHGDWGLCIVKESLSYVNKVPFSTGKTPAAIIGASGNFTVENFTATQNLISPSAEIFFSSRKGAFISVSYEGEFGSGYRTNQILLRIGHYF
jgi:uncharacterized protein with beta-barrel porin domain